MYLTPGLLVMVNNPEFVNKIQLVCILSVKYSLHEAFLSVKTEMTRFS